MKRTTLLLVISTFVCACSYIAVNRSQEEKIAELNERTYQYPKQDVFDACLSTLKANGWKITSANYEAGSITGERGLAAGPIGTPEERQSAVVSLVEKVRGRTEVRITAGVRYPNPGAQGAGVGPIRNMPKLCEPLLNGVQETLLRTGGK